MTNYFEFIALFWPHLTCLSLQEMFTLVQNAFDSTNCHFLPLNSRKPDQSGESDNSWVAENWLGFSHRYCHETGEIQWRPTSSFLLIRITLWRQLSALQSYSHFYFFKT